MAIYVVCRNVAQSLKERFHGFVVHVTGRLCTRKRHPESIVKRGRRSLATMNEDGDVRSKNAKVLPLKVACTEVAAKSSPSLVMTSVSRKKASGLNTCCETTALLCSKSPVAKASRRSAASSGVNKLLLVSRSPSVNMNMRRALALATPPPALQSEKSTVLDLWSICNSDRCSAVPTYAKTDH